MDMYEVSNESHFADTYVYVYVVWKHTVLSIMVHSIDMRQTVCVFKGCVPIVTALSYAKLQKASQHIH